MLTYSTEQSVTPEDFKSLLIRSTLSERRPIDDEAIIKGMIENSNLVVSCWEKEKLIGISRCVTDYHYCCYLSDLAIDASYQKKGIGKKLVEETAKALKPTCKIILLSAPTAKEYYPRIGFNQHPSAWITPVKEWV
ncbi:MAG: GNAT family N-acetyltransferase [Verrucomicrobiota bacterium]